MAKKTKVIHKSKCCNAEVGTSGIPDFLGSKEICTVNYICLKCNKPCNITEPQSSEKKESTEEKSVVIELNINDYIEVRLTKEGRKIYEEYRRIYKHDPLRNTDGRWSRITLWEFMHIFGPKIFMGPPAVIVKNRIRILKP